MPTASPIRAACLAIVTLALAMAPVVSAAPSDNVHACDSGHNEFVIEGDPNVDAQFCDDGHFKYDTEIAHRVSGGGAEMVHLNPANLNQPNGLIQAIILHEYAHVLGYVHGDGGVANTSTGITTEWRANGTLHPVTKDVVSHIDGYRVIDDNEDVLWLVNRARGTGRITNLEVLTAVNELQRGHELVLVTDSYGHYGGKFPDETFRGEFVFLVVDDDHRS
jgi:hypothetical protein